MELESAEFGDYGGLKRGQLTKGQGHGGIRAPHVLLLVGTVAQYLTPWQGELSELGLETTMAMLQPDIPLLPCVHLRFCLQGVRGEQGEKGSTGFPGARGPGGQKVKSWAPLATGGVLGACWGYYPPCLT